eukprot:NODE_751_length_4217_cov_0.448762.p2 type:complete len:245 gc:universal NODE_751_length_4217_cov_0.448762:1746-2480(+)
MIYLIPAILITVASLFGCWFAQSVFPKRGKVFILILVGFLCCLVIEASIVVEQVYNQKMIRSIVESIAYIAVFTIVNLLYVLRIQSLGVKRDQFAKFTGHLFWILAVLIVSFNLLQTYGIISDWIHFWVTIFLFAIAYIIETVLYHRLIKASDFMLAYRRRVKKRVIFKAKVYFVILVMLEALYMFIKCFYMNTNSIKDHVKVFSFCIRLFIVIDFYRDLIKAYRQDEENDYIAGSYFQYNDFE